MGYFNLFAGKLPSACRRSLYVTAMAMLMFAAKLYHMNDVNDLLSSSAPYDVSDTSLHYAAKLWPC